MQSWRLSCADKRLGRSLLFAHLEGRPPPCPSPPQGIEPDADSDGIPDVEESKGDTDFDGSPDYLDPDSDGDGIPDAVEGSGDADGDPG